MKTPSGGDESDCHAAAAARLGAISPTGRRRGGGGGSSAAAASSLLGLFEAPPSGAGASSPRPGPANKGGGEPSSGNPPPPPPPCSPPGEDADQSLRRRGGASEERSPLLPPIPNAPSDDVTPRSAASGGDRRGYYGAGEASSILNGGNTTDTATREGAASPAALHANNVVSWDAHLLPQPWSPALTCGEEASSYRRHTFRGKLGALRHRTSRKLRQCLHQFSSISLVGFFIGSTTSVLYHCVFSLAMASSVTRRYAPDPTVSLLGPIAKMTALGVIVAGPPLVHVLGPETPALYPSADLFLAPFFAEMGRVVDETLHQKRMEGGGGDNLLEDDTPLFLGTFATLAALGMLLSSLLCILAAKVKLANLGAFLPHAVICGFFSSIGVMVWTLSFGVDTGGAKVQDVVLGRDGAPSFAEALVHHVPSFAAGVAMKILCPRNAIYLPVSIGFIILVAYAIMLATGTSMVEAQRNGWFWTTEELIGVERVHGMTGYASAGPPAPFGVLQALFQGNVDGDAIVAGLPTVAATALIYALRCSLHAVALKKLGAVLEKKKMMETAAAAAAMVSPAVARKRAYSDAVSVNNMSFGDTTSVGDLLAPFDDESFALEVSLRSLKTGQGGTGNGGHGNGNGGQQPTRSLDNLRTLLWYGLCHLLSSLVGGFSGLPAFAVGAVLSELGVEGLAPQYGGIAILVGCYVTDFSVVRYIPKAVFSSLLVLCFLDFIWKWFVVSYFKTKDIWEWLVVPAIVIVAFMVPLLEAVVLGVAASTFIFVGAFYGSGVVKFASTGLSIRSTVDRMDGESEILDTKGDVIQLLVLQNYVFFGNANSILQYIQTMFEEPPLDASIDFEIPPLPKYIVLDFSLVTGMDTSSVDIVSEMLALCREEKCALLFSGLSKRFKAILSCGGVKPTPKALLFCYDLDSALGKAEDSLLNENRRAQQEQMEGLQLPERGLPRALALIQTVQGVACVEQLRGLDRYMIPLTVLPRQYLFGSDLNPNGGIIPDHKRGLFFIERGSLRIERDPNAFLTHQLTKRSAGVKNAGSIGHLNARSATVGKLADLLKANRAPSRPFRLAKIGPGWVIGAVEGCSGLRNPGAYAAVTECRLFHLPYSELGRIERDDPLLALNLFKLLAHIVSRRQISAIEQLGTLHSIITSPPLSQPRCRVTMGAINSAVKSSGQV